MHANTKKIQSMITFTSLINYEYITVWSDLVIDDKIYEEW